VVHEMFGDLRPDALPAKFFPDDDRAEPSDRRVNHRNPAAGKSTVALGDNGIEIGMSEMKPHQSREIQMPIVGRKIFEELYFRRLRRTEIQHMGYGTDLFPFPLDGGAGAICPAAERIFLHDVVSEFLVVPRLGD